MTKVISLSERAYKLLKGAKMKNESFSDVVLRLVRPNESKSLLAFSGKWSGNDTDRVLHIIMRDRRAFRGREASL